MAETTLWIYHRCLEKVQHPETRKLLSGKNLRLCTKYFLFNKWPLPTQYKHYFDNYHIEREAILPTSFCHGSSQYPLGMTIDIFEYQGKYEYDPSSVRYEILPGEQELMDNKPVEPSKLHMISVVCQNCDASYKKADGYAEKCPYCRSYQNT